MTALTLAAKPTSKVDMSDEEELKSLLKHLQRTILVVAIGSFLMALVLLGIIGGFQWYWYITNNNTKNLTTSEEWIFWRRSAGNVTIHESALINEEEQTALMISAGAYKINADNSLALHDFNKGYVALRDFNAEICYVTKIQFPDFSFVKKMVEERQGKQLPLQPLKRVHLQENVMTSFELGPKLTQFCKGVSARWFDVTRANEKVRRFRRRVQRRVRIPQVSCYINRFQFEERRQFLNRGLSKEQLLL